MIENEGKERWKKKKKQQTLYLLEYGLERRK